VKAICSSVGFESYWIAFSSLLVMIGIIVANLSDFSYYAVKVFFHSILSIFFASVEVLGTENIPAHGPIIFTGNHNNQFVDATVMVATIPHRVGFLIADKSYRQRVIGDFAKLLGAVPVVRPQDTAKKGVGQIRFEGLKMFGKGTEFTKLKKGDKIRPGRSPDGYKVKEVISDTEALLGEEVGEPSPLDERSCQLHLRSKGKGKDKDHAEQAVENPNGDNLWVTFDILGHMDQSVVFEKVFHALAQGQCIGIFPEGGSHDNTDLLPLKVGVAAIAFGVLDKFDVSVPIVPVGLNYFRGHRFRGRAVVEFGQPIFLDKALIQLYRESKREALSNLLGSVRDGMRSVIVAAADYSELKLIHTTRRLYQRPTSGMTTGDKQDLARRFSYAFRMLVERSETLPEELCELKKRIEKYQDTLAYWGLRDYQINQLSQLSFSKMLYTFVHGGLVMALASIPFLLLNGPVGIAARYWSYQEAQKDLKASRVKVAARDVILSKKIVFSIVTVPILWISYALLLFAFTSLSRGTILALFFACPIFSYFGVVAVQAGMTDIKDLTPAFLRLLPSFRKEMVRLPAMRAALQKEVRAMVKKYGPQFGAVYTGKASEWEKLARSQFKPEGDKDAITPGEHAPDAEVEGSRVHTTISSTELADDTHSSQILSDMSDKDKVGDTGLRMRLVPSKAGLME
jgi:glycerol-3-phosphate O-acyltransferase / dihydroxyacetone phosphate acyltransferase